MTDDDERAKFEDVDVYALNSQLRPSSRTMKKNKTFENESEKKFFDDSIGKSNVLRSELVVCINIIRRRKKRKSGSDESRKERRKKRRRKKNERTRKSLGVNKHTSYHMIFAPSENVTRKRERERS